MEIGNGDRERRRNKLNRQLAKQYSSQPSSVLEIGNGDWERRSSEHSKTAASCRLQADNQERRSERSMMAINSYQWILEAISGYQWLLRWLLAVAIKTKLCLATFLTCLTMCLTCLTTCLTCLTSVSHVSQCVSHVSQGVSQQRLTTTSHKK